MYFCSNLGCVNNFFHQVCLKLTGKYWLFVLLGNFRFRRNTSFKRKCWCKKESFRFVNQINTLIMQGCCQNSCIKKFLHNLNIGNILYHWSFATPILWLAYLALWAMSVIQSWCPFIYMFIYMSPHHVFYFKASHSPLDHIVSSRPLIGSHPPPQKKYKELFIYMNNWDKGMATAVCPCILSASEF